MPAFHEFRLGTINGRVQLQVQGPIPRAFMLHRKWNERSIGGVSSMSQGVHHLGGISTPAPTIAIDGTPVID